MKKHGNTGNRYAAKDDGEKLTCQIAFRCTLDEHRFVIESVKNVDGKKTITSVLRKLVQDEMDKAANK